MKCDNRMCIYEKNRECACSDEIEIDWRGICKNMIFARITADALENAKFYSTIILNSGDYHFDNETGRYVCSNNEFEYFD